MRKVTTTVAAALVAFSFAACNKTNNSVTPEEGGTGTKGAVIAQISAGSTNRALTDGQQDVAGVGGEDVVKDGYLFFKQGQSMDLEMKQVDTSNKYAWKSQIFETAPNAAAKATLLLNKNVNLTPADFVKTKSISLDNLKDFIKADGFMMTSTVEGEDNTLDIKAGKDDDAVKSGDNNFEFKVERVVSKLQVSRKADDALKVSDALKAMGTVSFDLKYALAGSAKSAYLFLDNAGSRTLDKATEGKHIYKGFKSIIDEEETPVLQKVSDLKAEGSTEYYLDGYYSGAKTVGTVADSNKESLADGFFFLENSMYGGERVATAKKQILFKRIAYAKVYTTFAPKAGKKINTTTLDKLSYKPENLTDAAATDFEAVREYDVIVPQEWYDKRKDKAEYAGKFTPVPEVKDPETGAVTTEAYVTFHVTDNKGDFYVGQDGKIYDTQLAAAAAGNETYRKFTGGKMVYMTPANAQKATDGDLINYCDTRRNNIYDLTIVGFEALGENFDPVDPKDPNIPEPGDNPGEPKPDPDKPVQEEVTKMMVKAAILMWNDVNRDVTLGK